MRSQARITDPSFNWTMEKKSKNKFTGLEFSRVTRYALISSRVLDLVFLLGPFVTLSCMFLIASPIPPNRRQRLFLLTTVMSGAGFLLTRHVFR